MVSASSPLATKIKSAKMVSRFTQEARFGGALDSVSDYAKIARSAGFSVRESIAIGARAMVSSEAQMGQCPPMTWQQDAKWTKF